MTHADHVDTEYEAADLLDEDGKLDPAKVRSITNADNMTDPEDGKITAAQCRSWRELAAHDTKPSAVPAECEPSTVRYHVIGECSHDPGAPPVRYDDDAEEWRPVE